MTKVLSRKDAVTMLNPFNRLGLTASDAFDYVYQWAGDVYGRDENGEPNCVFDKDMSCGTGVTATDERGDVTVSLGVKEFFTKTTLFGAEVDRKPDDKMPDYMFVGCVHAMCHERQHVRQHTSPDTPEDVALALAGSHCAGDAYYHAIWARSPAELDADYVGLNTAWDLIEGEFGDRGKTAMNRYINFSGCSGFVGKRNAKKADAFLPGVPLTREGINDAYSNAYSKCLSETWPAPAVAALADGRCVVDCVMGKDPRVCDYFQQPRSGRETLSAMVSCSGEFDSRVFNNYAALDPDKYASEQTMGFAIENMDKSWVSLRHRSLPLVTPLERARGGTASPAAAAEQSDQVKRAMETYQDLAARSEAKQPAVTASLAPEFAV